MSSINIPRIREALRRETNTLPANKSAAVRLLWPEISPLLESGHSYESIAAILAQFNLSVTATQLRSYCNRIRRSAKPTVPFVAGALEDVTHVQEDPAVSVALAATPHRDPFANVREHRKRDQKFSWNPFGSDDVLR